MPADPPRPDPVSVEKWRSLPQNKPSRAAYTPVMGGMRTHRTLLFDFGIFMLAAVISGLFFGR